MMNSTDLNNIYVVKNQYNKILLKYSKIFYDKLNGLHEIN